VEDITVEDIRNWQKRPVTKLFFTYLQSQKDGWDRSLHSLLRGYDGDVVEAYKANVAMDTITDVMEIPEIHMIPDIEEKNAT